MNKKESTAQLLHDLLLLGQTKLDIRVTQEPGQVVVAELEDEKEGTLEAVVAVGLGPTDLIQPHHVLVVQQLQDSDLAKGRDRESLTLILHQHLLKGHQLARILTSGLEYLPECALTDLCLLHVPARVAAEWKFQILLFLCSVSS